MHDEICRNRGRKTRARGRKGLPTLLEQLDGKLIPPRHSVPRRQWLARLCERHPRMTAWMRRARWWGSGQRPHRSPGRCRQEGSGGSICGNNWAPGALTEDEAEGRDGVEKAPDVGEGSGRRVGPPQPHLRRLASLHYSCVINPKN